MKQVYYTFQCNRCFIISGISSYNSDDAPYCCGGEVMRPIKHEFEIVAMSPLYGKHGW